MIWRPFYEPVRLGALATRDWELLASIIKHLPLTASQAIHLSYRERQRRDWQIIGPIDPAL